VFAVKIATCLVRQSSDWCVHRSHGAVIHLLRVEHSMGNGVRRCLEPRQVLAESSGAYGACCQSSRHSQRRTEPSAGFGRRCEHKLSRSLPEYVWLHCASNSNIKTCPGCSGPVEALTKSAMADVSVRVATRLLSHVQRCQCTTRMPYRYSSRT
jgi:hypothetical protein